MATLSLKNRHAQTIAQVEDDKVELVDTGQTATVGGQASKLVQVAPLPDAPPATPAVAAWVPEDELSRWNVRSVSIPQNFAGMETIAIPTRLKDQLFDITEVVETEDYVEITALHMFYRLADNITLWKPTEGLSYTGAATCRNVMTNALYDASYLVASDCTDTRPGDEMDYERRNIVETFLDPESGICARYGLSMIRDNDVFYCLKDVGYDRGFLIQNGKNLLGVERRTNTENLVTRVAPVGRDEDGEYVWLNRNGLKYVDSPHINDYPRPKAEVYYTDLTIGENGVTAENIQQKLYEEALTRFSIDEADIPEVTMTIQFISLGDTEEYKQYKDLDKVYLYDILTIKDTIRGFNYAAQVVGVEHNILTGMLESVTIGHLTETDGTRKIATWNVPEINGHKVRHKTIRVGSYERASIRTDDIADYAISSNHFSGGANNHFKAIFAEELYISNTSEDGLLNTRFTVTEGLIAAEVTRASTAEGTLSGALTVEAGKISQIVSAVGANGQVTAASIVLSINQTTGQGEVHIDADHVYINAGQSSEKNIVTEIGGKLVASDITTDFLSSRIAQIPTLTGIAASFSGNVSGTGGLFGAVYVGSGTSWKNISDPILAVQITGPTNNVYKLQYKSATQTSWTDAGSSFSRAVSSWSVGGGSGNVNVTANPQGQMKSVPISVSGPNSITSNGTYTYKAMFENSSGSDVETGASRSVTVNVSTSDRYNEGWNDALSACGIPNGGTVYTGNWEGTLFRAAYVGATAYAEVQNCLSGVRNHQLQPK